jgi:hypothetical protein
MPNMTVQRLPRFSRVSVSFALLSCPPLPVISARHPAPKAMLSSALFDEQSAWIGITTAQGAVEDLADLSQYEDNRPIEWPEMAEENPWNEMPQINFADDCVMDISGEPIKPVWVVDSGATHHLTPHRGLLRQVRPLAEPQIFGLADKKTTMTASEVGEVELELPSSQKMILKDVYLVPDSRISLISLSRMLSAQTDSRKVQEEWLNIRYAGWFNRRSKSAARVM